MKQMTWRLVLLAVLVALAGCGGIPLRSIPKLMQMQGDLLTLNPAEVMVALQVDSRMSPPPGAVPRLHIKLTPATAGAFEAVDKELPLAVAVTASATLGLAAPSAGRRWLIYTMPASTQTELTRIQGVMRQAKALPDGKGRGSLSLGVEQDSLASTEPALANTRWETWMQTKKVDGFFEVWSGTPAQLRAMAPKG